MVRTMELLKVGKGRREGKTEESLEKSSNQM
jgi:hypothetical protein